MTVPSATGRTNKSPRNDPNDTAINILEPYIGRISLEVYEDLHADLAGYIKDTRADEDAALSEERRLQGERIIFAANETSRRDPRSRIPA